MINLISVIKKYETQFYSTQVLKDVTLQINKGEFVSIMGPSGSGKSTLINIIATLDKPTQGKYFFNGIDIACLNNHELAVFRNKKIGIVFQSFYLIPRLTVFENIQLPLYYTNIRKEQRKKLGISYLTKIGLQDHVNKLPNQLSGGQRQKLAIARAIINEPEVILADEPTGNLDSNSSKEIMSIFNELHRQGVTIILVTHDKDIARYSQRIIKIVDGKIANNLRNNNCEV